MTGTHEMNETAFLWNGFCSILKYYIYFFYHKCWIFMLRVAVHLNSELMVLVSCAYICYIIIFAIRPKTDIDFCCSLVWVILWNQQYSEDAVHCCLNVKALVFCVMSGVKSNHLIRHTSCDSVDSLNSQSSAGSLASQQSALTSSDQKKLKKKNWVCQCLSTLFSTDEIDWLTGWLIHILSSILDMVL